MATRRRGGSLEQPLDFSKSTKKLMRHAASFISAFNISEPKMRQIVGEFQKIADEVKKMQETTDKQRRKGVLAGGLGLVMILATPLTGGTSLLAAGGLAAAAFGGVYAVDANVRKTREENRHVKEVEELGKEFMEIVELLKSDLEEIKTTSEELKSPSMKVQAAVTLSEVEVFHWMLTHVSELAETSVEVLGVAVTVMKMVHKMLLLIVSVFRVTATPEDDQKLIESIIQSADQCQKVVDDFDQLTEKLRHFTISWRYKTRSRSITV